MPVCLWQSISIIANQALGFLTQCLCTVEEIECELSTLDDLASRQLGELNCVYDQVLETGPVDKWSEKIEIAYFGDDEEGDQL